MHKPIKYVEKAVTIAATGAWAVFERLNRVAPNASPTPKWSDKPLLKSWEKSKPPLGWPRSTDSLCPRCVPEIRQQILDGHFEDLMSIDTESSQHLEEVFPGRAIKAHNDEKLHHHGSSTVKYGRGSV